MKHLQTFVITVKGHKTSEAYANFIKPRWRALGFKPQTFDAITPDTLPDYLHFTPIQSNKYSRHGFFKDHTPTEKAIWYSHTELWIKCMKLNEPIIVLEHDTVPIAPEHLIWDGKTSYQVYDRGAMGCYVITPEFAVWMLDFLTVRHGEVDSGPGSLIDWTTWFWKKDLDEAHLDVVVHRDSRYRPACTQVIDRRLGTVIDHYSGTQAEGMTWREFPHYKEITLPDL